MTSDEICVSGALLSKLRDSCELLVGTACVQRGLDRLDPERAREITHATSSTWVRNSTLEAFFNSVAGESGRPVTDLHEEVVRLNVERTLSTLWSMMLRLSTNEALTRRTPLLFAKSYNRGRADARVLEPGRAEVVVTGVPDADDWMLRAMRVGIKTMFTRSGRRNTVVTGETTSDGLKFVIQWDD